jgi:hypothetical protein
LKLKEKGALKSSFFDGKEYNLGMNITINKAKPEDAEEMAQIQSQTWLCSYANPGQGISQEDIEIHVERS